MTAIFLSPLPIALAELGIRHIVHCGGFAGVGVGAAIAHFGHTGRGFAGMPRGVHGWPATRSHWASTWDGGRSGTVVVSAAGMAAASAGGTAVVSAAGMRPEGAVASAADTVTGANRSVTGE